jgi:16S rRNA A1518/A1519 N6-dimethyltransferase RsmA/KsgA/DIM1 with predicted DNA glycosylase/AP lyase activity
LGDIKNTLPSLREVIDKHGLLAKKSLGQNFLLNMDVTRRIAKAAGPFEGTTVFEIGPGPGGLTRALLEAGAGVVAIERDHRCLEILADILKAFPNKLHVIEGDALKLAPQSAIPNGDPVAFKSGSHFVYDIDVSKRSRVTLDCQTADKSLWAVVDFDPVVM